MAKTVWDRELDDTFASYQVLPDHAYYITGGYGAPAAILAIHKDYQLVNDVNLWVPVPDISPARMREWVDSLSNDNQDFGTGSNLWPPISLTRTG